MRAALLFAAAVRCAYIRDVDDAGFLLMRCVYSPGATRVLLAGIIAPFLTQETKLNPKKSNIRVLSSDFGTRFSEVEIFRGSGE